MRQNRYSAGRLPNGQVLRPVMDPEHFPSVGIFTLRNYPTKRYAVVAFLRPVKYTSVGVYVHFCVKYDNVIRLTRISKVNFRKIRHWKKIPSPIFLFLAKHFETNNFNKVQAQEELAFHDFGAREINLSVLNRTRLVFGFWTRTRKALFQVSFVEKKNFP